VSPLGKLDGFDSWLIEKNGALEHIHGRSIQPGAQIDVAPALLRFTLDNRGSCLTGEPGCMKQVVILKNSDGAGPFQCCQGGLHWTSQCIVESEQSGSLARAKHEVRQAFGPVREGPDDKSLSRGHEKNIAA